MICIDLFDAQVPDDLHFGEPICAAAAWPELRVEYRRIEAGRLNPVTFQWSELAFVLSGRTYTTRTGNGQTRHHFIQPGQACICPVGTYESMPAQGL